MLKNYAEASAEVFEVSGAILRANVQELTKIYKNHKETFKNYVETYKNYMGTVKNFGKFLTCGS
jgi:hypothetical protein